MAKVINEVIDSQIVAEHVEFLDHCFDNSFTLQSSLVAVKEYVAEEQNLTKYSGVKRNERLSSKNTNTLQNQSYLLDTTSIKVSQNKKTVFNKNIKNWGLPYEIAKKYEQKGITEMFDWQVTCLGNLKILRDYCNLVYSAPTSAGKTLVAEILTIKTILERQKKVIIILPFVSIVREKMFYLQDILSSSGIRVEGFMGAQSPPGGLQAVHVAICTIEKANSLVNRLLDDGNISELGAVVIDELHLLGDLHRGYILELLLTKIKYVCSQLDNVQIQIVGMSATLPNIEVLASWLGAELFVTEFRPIPLDEYCLVGNKIYNKHGICINYTDTSKSAVTENENVLKICLDTIKDGCSILIFCMTKNRCENLAHTLASSFYQLGCQECEEGSFLRNQLKTDSILEVLEQLKNCPVSLDQVLKKTISFGVAYHHAGLTFDERDIIEGGFKSGAIRVLVATSTLSSGVNLPARKVIIRSPVFQRQPINILTYKQMIGRAGRMGKDLKGESILICTETEKKIGFDLMMGALNPVKSCIENEDKYMRAVLEMIASQALCTNAELYLYSKCTLLYTQQKKSPSQNSLLENTLKELQNYELVRTQTVGNDVHYVATPLGKACLSASMAPNDGLSLFCELQKARQCLVLETDLHLIYLVTPYSVSNQWSDIDWLHLLTLWESLTKSMKRVGELVGVQESFIIRCLRGTNKLNNAQSKLNIHKRFYTALALQDLVNEVPLSEVSSKFQCARGFLQSLQQAAATFAGMVTAFCHQLGWKNMEMLVSQFQDRLQFGIHSDLIELMKLPSLNGTRARTLFDSGFETITSIASADVNIIENILHKAVPFQSEKEREDDDSVDIRKRNKLKTIWITGYCGMTIKEAAQNLILEAKRYLEFEIAGTVIKWNNKISGCINSLDTPSNIGTSPKDLTDKQEGNEFQTSMFYAKIGTEIISNKSKLPLENVHANSNEDLYVSANNKNEVAENNLYKSVPDSKDFMDETDLSKINNENEIYEIKYQPVLKNIKSNASSNTSSRSVTTKEELVWESLNFTEAAIDNITKSRMVDKHFSPNISFGETEEKSIVLVNISNNLPSPKHTSVKDISLFSSDGDNSNIFEESLPLDLIPSKVIDGQKDITKSLCMQEVTTDYVNIHSNSLLNAFKSSLVETDEDEDIKLVYEEDNKLTDSEPENGFNASKDIEVICTPEANDAKTDFKSPYKRQTEIKRETLQPLIKKKKLEMTSILQCNGKTELFNSSKLHCAGSRKITMEVGKHKMDCVLLKGNNIFENLHVIESVKIVSIYLNFNNESHTFNEMIGSNIVKFAKSREAIVEAKHENCNVNGIGVYLGQALCIFLDITSIDSMLLIKERLCRWLQKCSFMKMISLKENYLHIKKWLGINLPIRALDISLANWLIDSGDKIPNLITLAKRYCRIDLSTISLKIDKQMKKLKNLDVFEDACVRAWIVSMIAEKQEEYLKNPFKNLKLTLDTETHISKILADCEYYGITVDKNLASQLLNDVKSSQEVLQRKAFKISGHRFDFNSSKAVAKVLGMYNGRKVSTKKSVLSSHNSPLSRIVIFWRKLNSILTKTLYPLTEKACIYSKENRINPSYTMYTCTGRVSMHEPNLQNVPRTFSIPVEYLTNDANSDEIIEFNCRKIFRASPGHVMVSADYCQLEMRILTHFSKDPVFMNIMNSDVDVFKSIAASWCHIPEEDVDDDLRQKAKQLCYGILYGMGKKTLAQNLDVNELEAAVFMDSFYKTYPMVKTYTQSVIEECKKNGYIETLMKRRRYLPDINSNVISKRSAAERQAVNTTIQGSAADIVKAAMCAIDTKTNVGGSYPRLVLQMHDELIYEVPQHTKQSFIPTMKEIMEETVTLTVPLPVKIKSGETWGSLQEIIK